MINLRPPEGRASPAVAPASPCPPVTAEKAFSFISRGWREVKDSADADLRLIKDRANSFKNLASSFDRELENFLYSASKSTFAVPAIRSSSTEEIDFVKRLQPKLSEIRRAYSSPDFSRKVLEKWSPRARIRLDLSAIRNMVSEVGDDIEGLDDRETYRKGRKVGFRDFRWDWKAESGANEGQSSDWEPIRAFKSRLRELEQKNSSSVIENLKNSEFVEKVKSSLKSICKEQSDSKEVPQIDVPELLAYLVRQSGTFFDQLGIKSEIPDKIVESLCSKRKDEASMIDSDNINGELDLRIASGLQSTGHQYDDMKRDPSSDNKRHVAIVTTASLPWMTGTAVNPLFRAAYLAKSAKQNVTLLVPWLCHSDQQLVYPNITFSSPEEQEVYIRKWVEERVGFEANFKISFYPGKFSKERRSIIPAGDTTQFIPYRDADIAILEEPEHLNWYHHGKRWTDKFNHVVGIVHTNYLEYIKREKNGMIQAFLVKHINNWVARAYCHKILRLSAATQDLPKSTICNVHGVNPKFLKIGERIAEERERGEKSFTNGAYFLGKMVWAKGYRELIDLLAKQKNDLAGFKMDVFGNGEDAHEVQSMARELDLNLNFMKGRDHADDSLHGYKVFINPSVSDVLCTATAEALAMGKFVICANHPSNEFFRTFPNCLTYTNPDDFVEKLREAMSSEPQPLTPEQMYQLSWEAATQRFLEFSDLDEVLNTDRSNSSRIVKAKANRMGKKSASMPNLSNIVDGGLAYAHYCLTGNEFLRLCTGAIPGTRDYDMQHSKDLRLLPPQVENRIYGW
ncbi:digalactosyldiacylglycerol synthase 1, chloroplastic-like [Impatiens glandulifera]|uniref:digalactosyldiacylglycerol synthase 1, chloroplastic-like n=1 Tax=Impatiens glandulifera TaxID=253017 RepID=UPI001FB0B793|nr:digalactosyldiacylglycerol synthase 1, chloroplastic-like [Impatiens glandulifera]